MTPLLAPQSAHTPLQGGKIPGWLVGLLVLAWLLPGLLGHDPWKPDEAYSMGLILHILESGDWVVPTLGGEPFMEKPPLYYLTAAGMARLLSPLLPLHDAARLTSGLYMGIVLLCVGLTGRRLFGRGNGRVSLLLLMGCLGLLPHAHQMITDTALLAGFAIALYGLSLAQERPVSGGALLGLGSGIGFMAKGLLAPLILGGVVVLLLAFPAWRSRRFAAALGVALLLALPWLTLWPYTLYQQHPELFDVWFWENNYGRFFGSSGLATRQEPGYYLKALLWFSGPAIPLAMVTLWQSWNRRGASPTALPSSPLLLPLVMATVVLATLFASTATRTLYILPLLLPVSLLATPAVAGSNTVPNPRWSRLLVVLFGVLALLIWVVWLLAITRHLAVDDWHIAWLSEAVILPESGEIPLQWPAFAAACLATAAWAVGMTQAGRSPRHLLAGWTGGVALLWLLSMTIWLPVIDYGKTYRAMVMGLRESLPVQEGCMASRELGEPQRAMLHYFGQIFTRRIESDPAAKGCALLLIQSPSAQVRNPPGDGQLIWQGRRPKDGKEWYFLYKMAR
ncbi:MAG: glycosyltransferase family 39 protein [Magnetococcus sp. YQC-3]